MTKQPAPNSDSADAALESFIKHAREAKTNAAPVLSYPVLDPKERTRRTLLYGAGLGFLASLIFAIISVGVNIAMLPGLALYSAWFIPARMILLILAVGTIFGLVSVASMTYQNQIAAFIALVILILIFNKHYNDYGSLLGGFMESILFLFYFLIPILFILLIPVPYYLLLRWAVRAQVSHHYRPIYASHRLVPAVTLFAVAAVVGSLFVFSRQERQAVQTMDALMSEASTAQAEEQLPYAVRYAMGTPFFPYAEGAYALNAMHNPIPQRVYADGRPYVMDVSVTAEFSSGYWLTCDFGRKTGKVLTCRGDAASE